MHYKKISLISLGVRFCWAFFQVQKYFDKHTGWVKLQKMSGILSNTNHHAFLIRREKITPDWLFTVEITIQYSAGFLYSICVTICTPLGAVDDKRMYCTMHILHSTRMKSFKLKNTIHSPLMRITNGWIHVYASF